MKTKKSDQHLFLTIRIKRFGWRVVPLIAAMLLPSFSALAVPPDVSIVPPLGRTLWTGAGVPGGIPSDNADPAAHPYGVGGAIQHGTTLTPTGGDDTALIRNALSAARAHASLTSRRYVRLGGGTFNISGVITIPSFVTLRGTKGQNNAPITIINQTSNSTGMFALSGAVDSQWRPVVDTVGVQFKDAHQITVTDASSFNVGDIITIDHLDDGPPRGPADGNFLCDPPNITGRCVAHESSLFYQRQPYSAGNGTNFLFPNSADGFRTMSQQTEVLAKSGNVLTIYDPTTGRGAPLHATYYNAPQVYHTGGLTDVARWLGLEDMKLLPNGTNGQRVVVSNQAAFAWVKNIEIDGAANTWAGRHIQFWQGVYKSEIRDSYFHESSSYFQGANAYGIVVSSGASNILVENNIAHTLNKPIVLESAGPAIVIAYNYAENAIIARNQQGIPSNDTMNSFQEAAISTHGSFVHNTLFEGNWAPNYTIDSTHGNNAWNTFFKNFASIRNENNYATAYNRAISVDGWNHAQYSIANVFGGPGSPTIQHTTLHPGLGINPLFGGPVMAYMIGYNAFRITGNGTGGNPGGDYGDNGYAYSQFHAHLDHIEGHLTSAQNANQNNPVTTIPNSLYLTRKPSFFGINEWPWIDPTGNTHADRVKVLPARARYLAGTPHALAPGAGLPPDNINPTVTITSPSQAQNVMGQVAITATASDNADVAFVRFLVDGTLLDTDFTSPYSAQWDSTLFPNENHTLTAIAQDTSANTGTATVTVTVNNPILPPSITGQPSPQTVSAGGSATFSVAVAGTPPIAYQWQRNGSDIPGATDQTYTTPATTLADNGTSFRVRVSNSAGAVFSAVANLTVNEGPTAQVSYNFDEESGQILFDRSGSRDGAVNGAIWTNGRHDGGLFFDGVNDFVSLGNWNVSGSAITLSAWVNSPNWNSSADVRIISKASGTAEQSHTFMLSERGGQPRVRLKTNGTTQTLVGNSTLPTDTWVHIAAVYDGVTLRLYQDGLPVGAAAQSGSISQSSEQITLGMNPDNSNHFQGAMDDVRIYDAALSQAEIQASMSIPVGGSVGGGDTLAPSAPSGLRIQ